MSSSSQYIGKMVHVKMDRPLGTKHPKHGFIYEVNYGFVPNTVSGDGEEIDVYVLGVHDPINEFVGKCVAVIHRVDDDDDKLIVVPEGFNVSDEEIEKKTDFQEKWFKHIIIRRKRIAVANEDDVVVGSVCRGGLIEQGKNPMIAAVLLFNSKGNIILQKISHNKQDDKDVLKWSYSAGGHVDEGETYEEAAIRELKEEMGIEGKIDRFIGKTRTIREGVKTAFHHGFKVIHDGPYVYDSEEVEEIREFSIDEIKKMIAENPDRFKQTFIDIFNQL